MDGKTPYVYTLRIMGDSPAEIREKDVELWAEIARARGAHEDDDNATLRWLGDLLDEVEDELNSILPIGWYAKIENGKVTPDD